MDDVAAPDQQDAPLAKGREPDAEIEMLCEPLERVDRQLDDRDVRVRQHVDEDRPGPVIETPTVAVEPDPTRPRRFDDLLRDRG